jgi:7-cyano-7-deazaguanine synthase
MTIYASLSGGLDSTTLVGLLQNPDEPMVGVSFAYGQRHAKELEAAEKVAAYYGIEHRVVSLPRLSSPALTDGGPVPHGHYTAASMSLTVVQGRNLLFLSTLVALTEPGDTVAIGVHAGDHAIYADCRPAFIDPLTQAVAAAYQVTVKAPFLHQTKGQIAAKGHQINAPLHLSWSCYEGGEIHCGRCGTCVERIEAFMDAEVADPTTYADRDFALAEIEANR